MDPEMAPGFKGIVEEVAIAQGGSHALAENSQVRVTVRC